MGVTTVDLWRMSAADLAEAIRSRQISTREVVEAHLQRIEGVNPAVNAVTVVLAEQALDAAEAADRVTAAGVDLPALHGVPFTVKENIDLVGTPTTQGLKALANTFPTCDAPVVERLRAAEGIPIGRTNCPTITVRWHTDSELWGPTFNPWDRSRTPGASSGGEAVAQLEPPSIDLAAQCLLDMLNTPEIRGQWQLMGSFLPEDTQRFLSAFYRVAGDPDPATVMQIFMARQSLLRTWSGFQESHPLIVGPVFTDIAFRADVDLDIVPETIRGLRLTMAVNALGLPAAAVPVGAAQGLPQVVQIIGPRYREDLCLDAAAALENRLGIITPIDPR